MRYRIVVHDQDENTDVQVPWLATLFRDDEDAVTAMEQCWGSTPAAAALAVTEQWKERELRDLPSTTKRYIWEPR